MRALVFMLVVLGLAAGFAHAQTPERKPATQLTIPDAARPGSGFDIERATRAYLATIPAEKRIRSDAYFEGG